MSADEYERPPYDLQHPRVLGYVTTCTAAPYQIEGLLVGSGAFYFRERHGRATLGIGPTPEHAVEATIPTIPVPVKLTGSMRSASIPCEFIESAEQLNEVFSELMERVDHA